MNMEEKADNFRVLITQLGYVKRNTGVWVEEVQDDGSGYPRVLYRCPFCGQVTDYNTNYCPDCGAKLSGNDG